MRAWLSRLPLRVKLVATVLALVTLALVLIATASAYALRQYLYTELDNDLRRITADANAAVLEGQPSAAFPSDYMVAYTNGGRWIVIKPSYVRDAQLPTLPPVNSLAPRPDQAEPRTVKAGDSTLRWRWVNTTLPTGQQFIVAKSTSSVDHAVTRLLWIDFLVGLAVLLSVGAIGVAIIRTSLRQLGEIERTAGAIASGDLTRRVPDPEPDEPEPRTELGRLSRALNTMLTQIEAAFTARAASETAARSAESAARDAAQEAQVSEARARRSEERMRQFVADASHELRTPLTSIRGFAELYRQGAAREPTEVARLLRRIEDEAARMGLLVEDLLLLARLDRERPLTLAPVELPVIAADAVQAAQAVAPDRRITLDVGEGAGELVVLGDDGRLRQVIGNLMANALMHTPAGSAVTVRLRVGVGEALVEVVDEGPGLTQEQAERAFERFYRADKARMRRDGGESSTGLGLAIVAALVAAHSGSVSVDSKPGEGATFRVRLPLASVHS